MLDQNTDRMWYVIGAVLVGAAIILIANRTLPELFASVTDSFEETAQRGTKVIDQMDLLAGYSGNLIRRGVHTYHHDQHIDSSTGKIVSNVSDSWYSVIGDIAVTPGVTYQFYAEEGIASAIIYYYDAADKVLVKTHAGNLTFDGAILEAPEGAAYARIGAGDKTIDGRGHMNVAEPSEWIFRRYPGD